MYLHTFETHPAMSKSAMDEASFPPMENGAKKP